MKTNMECQRNVDKALNIHLIFMNLSPLSEEFAVTKSRLRGIISSNEFIGNALKNRQVGLQGSNPLAIARSRTSNNANTVPTTPNSFKLNLSNI